jgi:hypothetical protein
MGTVVQYVDVLAARFLATAYPALWSAGTNFQVEGLAFDSAANECAYYPIRLGGYGSGNITFDIDWIADTGTSGAVVFGVSIGAITPGDNVDLTTDALDTEATTSKNHDGTTARRPHRTTVVVSALDSAAADDIVHFRLKRLSAGNGLSGDAIVTGMIKVSYSDT